MSKETETLGTKLHRALLERNWSQSDFCRKLWPGETIIDSRGYTAPKGRDRVSAWLADKNTPQPQQLQRIAEVLGMPAEELAPGGLSSVNERETPALQISVLTGAPDRCMVRVNKLLPLSVALEIARLVEQAS